MAHDKGLNRETAKMSKPGISGAGERFGDIGEFGGCWGFFDEEEDDERRGWMSGPPQVAVMTRMTENAERAVVTSEGSRAKCSTAEMTFSKMGWLAVAVRVIKLEDLERLT